MEQNKEPRNKPTQTRSLASEQSQYHVEEIGFQQLVEQLTATYKKKNLGLEDVAVGKNSSHSYRDPASTHSTLVCSQLPLTAAPGDCSVSISLTLYFHYDSPRHALLSAPTPADFLLLPN